MRFRRLLLALFALAGSAAAQFTVVTGTVTDPNGLAYANGTIVSTLVTSASPTLSGLPYSPPSGATQLDGSGKFTIRLGDNSVLLPASTQWTFLICSSAGTVNPAIGKGPVCFTVPALTISGSSQSITSNIAAVPPPALTSVTSGSLTSVAATTPITATPNPIIATGTIACPTCAIGPGSSTTNHLAAFAGTDGVTLKDISGPSFVSVTNKPYISAQDYGVVGEGHFSFNATITSGSAVVTCTDCHFSTNATVGQIVFGSNLGAGGFSFTTVIELPQTTILSIDSDTQIHANTTATGNGGFLVWGTDESTPLANAWTAAFGACSQLVLPGVNPEGTGPAVILTQQSQFAGNGTSCVGTGGARNGVGVQGYGVGSSYIMITPNFSPPVSGHAMFFDGVTDGLDIHDFTIHGGGNSAPGANFLNRIGLKINANNNAKAHDIALLFFGGNEISGANFFPGLLVNGGAISLENVDEDGFGSVGCEFTSSNDIGPISMRYQVCFDNAYVNLFLNDGNVAPIEPVISVGGYYGNTLSASNLSAVLDIIGSSQFISNGDQFGCGGSGCGGGNAIVVGYDIIHGTAGSAAQLTMSNSQAVMTVGTASGSFIYMDNSNDIVRLINNYSLQCGTGSASGSTFIQNKGVLQDLGGNTFTQGSCTNLYSGTGRITSQPSLANATTITAAKAVLSSGWGTTAAWSALAGGNNFTGTITASGTGQAANPTITYTFPTPYFTSPFWCQAQQVGGTQANGTFTTGSLSSTGVTFTYSGTPVASDTLFVQVNCQ